MPGPFPSKTCFNQNLLQRTSIPSHCANMYLTICSIIVSAMALTKIKTGSHWMKRIYFGYQQTFGLIAHPYLAAV